MKSSRDATRVLYTREVEIAPSPYNFVALSPVSVRSSTIQHSHTSNTRGLHPVTYAVNFLKSKNVKFQEVSFLFRMCTRLFSRDNEDLGLDTPVSWYGNQEPRSHILPATTETGNPANQAPTRASFTHRNVPSNKDASSF